MLCSAGTLNRAGNSLQASGEFHGHRPDRSNVRCRKSRQAALSSWSGPSRSSTSQNPVLWPIHPPDGSQGIFAITWYKAARIPKNGVGSSKHADHEGAWRCSAPAASLLAAF